MNPVKAIIKGLVHCFGFDIVRHVDKRPAMIEEYEAVYPAATYSPWNTDKDFQSIYAAIQSVTLVDQYRCFELWKLVEQVAKLEHGNIVEIGVWRGGTGALIATQAMKCGITEKVYLCDTFTGVVKAGVKDSAYVGGEHSDTSSQSVRDLIHSRMNLSNVEILEGIFPEQTGHYVENLQFRLCHIDVDVYQSAKDIVNWIWDKMVPGGVMVYDDYGFCGCDGITKYVEEQIKCKDRIVIHNLNGHAIVVKL